MLTLFLKRESRIPLITLVTIVKGLKVHFHFSYIIFL